MNSLSELPTPYGGAYKVNRPGLNGSNLDGKPESVIFANIEPHGEARET